MQGIRWNLNPFTFIPPRKKSNARFHGQVFWLVANLSFFAPSQDLMIPVDISKGQKRYLQQRGCTGFSPDFPFKPFQAPMKS